MHITLEKFGPQNFGDYLRLVGNPEVMAMITERAIPAEEAQRDYEKLLADNGLHPELGHILAPEYWGKGIASRMASLLVARAERQTTLRSLFAIIDPANIPSRKILINNGFVSREFKDFDSLPGEVLERSW